MHTLTRLTDRLVATMAVGALALTGFACGDSNGDRAEIEGTYVHASEGTIVLEEGGNGTITQSAEPTPFGWQREGGTIEITIDGDVAAVATVDDDQLTFRPGDFSGDEAVTFIRAGD